MSVRDTESVTSVLSCLLVLDLFRNRWEVSVEDWNVTNHLFHVILSKKFFFTTFLEGYTVLYILVLKPCSYGIIKHKLQKEYLFSALSVDCAWSLFKFVYLSAV